MLLLLKANKRFTVRCYASAVFGVAQSLSVIIILQYLCSSLKSRQYIGADGFRLELSEEFGFEMSFEGVYSGARCEMFCVVRSGTAMFLL